MVILIEVFNRSYIVQDNYLRLDIIISFIILREDPNITCSAKTILAIIRQIFHRNRLIDSSVDVLFYPLNDTI